ncbi:MAG: ATP-binding protein [Candidatus Melainabacteria bacterium]|nr:MAG: ATP-binding protein [Candidatus Melainabacteria bacterium]
MNKNKTSALRRGFYYQDLCALRIMSSWLKSPEIYSWIQFEVSDLAEKTSSLDDIVIAHANGSLELQQVKHVQNPQDSWTWEDFLKTSKSKQGANLPSLIERWSKSFFAIREGKKITSTSLITDGTADLKITSAMFDNKVSLEILEQNSPDVFERLCKQIPNEKERHDFFGIFEFHFKNENPEKVFEQLREEFVEILRSTDAGFKNVLHNVQEEARRPITSKITIEKIKDWCEFDEPRSLDQDFQIPEDFQLFDTVKHSRLVSQLEDPNGGFIVVTGKPGSGKSTYLSKLSELLGEKEIPCIQHYYHIEVGHEEEHERLFCERAIESLKAQLKSYHNEIGELSAKNSAGVPVHEYLDSFAYTLQAKKKTLVLLIDGLDNAIRGTSEIELRNLLTEICRPRKNLWIVLGMQESARIHLPKIVEKECPKEKWIHVNGLSESDVESIFKSNIVQLKLPNSDFEKKKVATKLFQITEGNPLHLRYSLRELKKKNLQTVTLSDCEKLEPFGGDIANYYTTLWQTIPEFSKTILLSLVNTDFPLTRKQLLEFLSTFALPNDISPGLSNVEHLTEICRSGIRIFHDSLRVFAKKQKEYDEQKISLSRKMLTWLIDSSYENLIWSESKKLSWILGDSKPVLSIDRMWLVDAICYPREPFRILQQLKLGAEVAFSENNFGKCLELSHYHLLYSNALDSGEYAVDKIWKESIRFAEIKSLAGWNLPSLSSSAIEGLIWRVSELSPNFIEDLDDCLNALDRRHRNLEIYNKNSIYSTPPELPMKLVSIASIDPVISNSRIFRYIENFKNEGWEADLVEQFTKGLLQRKQFNRVSEFKRLKLSRAAKRVIEVCQVEHELISDSQFNKTASDNIDVSEGNLFTVVFLSIKNRTALEVPVLPALEEIPLELNDYSSTEEENFQNLLKDFFLKGVLLGLGQRKSIVKEWYESARNCSTQLVAAKVLEIGYLVGDKVAKNTSIDVFLPIRLIEAIPEITVHDRANFGLRKVLRNSVRSIVKYVAYLKKFLDGSIESNRDNIDRFLKNEHVNIFDFFQILIDSKIPILSMEDYSYFEKIAEEYIHDLKEGFNQRAEWYCDLALIASIYGNRESHKKFLKSATENFIGFGMRDSLVEEILDALSLLHTNGIDILHYMKQIAPIVLSIPDYCEETSHLPSKLCQLIGGSANKKLLFSYYDQNCSVENYDLAETAFHEILKFLPLTNVFELGLARTGIDEGSLKILSSRARGGAKISSILEELDVFCSFDDSELKDEKYSGINNSDFEFDPSMIQPGNLKNFLDSKKSYERNKYIVEWISFWLNKSSDLAKIAYSEAKELVSDDSPYLSSEILDSIFEHSWQEEPSNSFEMVVKAHAFSYGWSFRQSDKRKREKRWKFVKEYFPERALDFYRDSILEVSKKSYSTNPPFTPVALGVQYFVEFGLRNIATEIIDSALSLARELFADVSLTDIEWKNNTEVLDLLIERLHWPSQMVREKVAVVIAELINQESTRELTFRKLKNWTANQSLDSISILGLLPIFKVEYAVVLNLDLQGLVDSLQSHNQLTNEITQELNERFDLRLSIQNHSVSETLSVPESYVPSSFFSNGLIQLISPSMISAVEEIEDDFARIWSFTADELMRLHKIEIRVDLLRDFGLRNGAIFGLSYKASEAYKTALLRVLQNFHSRKLISKETLLKFSLKVFPVDLSLWFTKTDRKPEWWVGVKAEKNDLTQEFCSNLVKRMSNQLSIDSDDILGGCCGSVVMESENSQVFSIYLCTALFAYMGDIDFSKANSNVVEEILHSTLTVLDLQSSKRKLDFFKSVDSHIVKGGDPFRFDSGAIFPLVSRLNGPEVNNWQWYRKYSPVEQFIQFGPNLKFFKNYSISQGEFGWSYFQDGTLLATAGDWLEKLSERDSNQQYIEYGTFIKFSASRLLDDLVVDGAKLGIAAKITQKTVDMPYSSRDIKHKDFFIIEEICKKN